MKQKILKGFTMIELLVAMAIIGLLIATAIWGISLAQQGARNTQRRENGSQILAAMSEFYSRYNTQPTGFFETSQRVLRFCSTCTTLCTANYYEITLQGVGDPNPVANHTQLPSCTPLFTAPGPFFSATETTYYSIGSTNNGYRVCVGLEGSVNSYANLSEKANLVTCP